VTATSTRTVPPGIYPVAYNEKYGRLGHAIDQLVTCHSAR
jgi:hypothetical protein